jgi:NADP-dependent 3-hydroxy acid dehydrogenase YdfG
VNYEKVLITGCSSGIGWGMARWWARRGATVWATARRVKNLDELAAEGEGRIKAVAMDVMNGAETIARIEQIDDECGGLDLVIANAGVGSVTPARTTSWATIETVLRTNVLGSAATITAVVARMVKRGHGHVAAISSVAGYSGLPGTSAYSGSKAFLSRFLESLSIDLYGTGVKVTCIEPGFVGTPANQKLNPPFLAPLDKAVDKFGRAILRGQRRLAWPTVHAMGASALTWLPSAIVEPLAQRASAKQIAQLEAGSK